MQYEAVKQLDSKGTGNITIQDFKFTEHATACVARIDLKSIDQP